MPQKGYVNLHIDTETRRIYASNYPYPTRDEAEKGIFVGPNIERIGTFEIEYQ